MSGQSIKREGSPGIGGTAKKHKSNIDPYKYDLKTVTVDNLEDSIEDLDRHKDLEDLNIAVHFSNMSGRKFLSKYFEWYHLRAFSRLDEHFLRMYLINHSVTSRQKSQELSKLVRAVQTYGCIWEESKFANKPDVALAAAAKVLDYCMSCYCTSLSEAAIIKLIPDIDDRFAAAAEFVKEAGPRAGPHALRHQLSRQLPDGTREFTGFANTTSEANDKARHVPQAPMDIGAPQQPPAHVGVPQPPPIHIGGAHPESEGQDIVKLIEATIVDTTKRMQTQCELLKKLCSYYC